MRATVSQLIKEFWLPFTLAILWTTFDSFENANHRTVATIVPIFSASFFLFSWLSGQVVRVRRQARVEGGLNDVATRMDGLLGRLDATTERLVATVTGGDSFAYVNFIATGPNRIIAQALLSVGNFPLANVGARIVDLQAFDAIVEGPNPFAADHTVFAAELAPQMAIMVTTVPAFTPATDKMDFNVFFSARNGWWTQMVRFRKVDGEWRSAFVVMRDDDSPLYGRIDEGFPLIGDDKFDGFERGPAPHFQGLNGEA
jgi:hypothetical protein